MTDNGLIQLLVAGFVAILPARVAFPVEVKQNYPPSQQGVKSGPVLYLHKIGEVRRGWVQRKDVYDPAADAGRGFASVPPDRGSASVDLRLGQLHPIRRLKCRPWRAMIFSAKLAGI